MVKRILVWVLLNLLVIASLASAAEQVGGLRGLVMDKDFDTPLNNAKILIAETGITATTSDEGNYVLTDIQPGAYTIVISKDGYTRQVNANIVISPGQMTDLDASLSGEFEEMEEFIVQDVLIGAGSEAALLELRMESPSLMDSISSDLMSQAGASDAASALKLVSGATVQDGKFAVIRGLPDRYVNSQMNAVRLPTADADKRAVQLDQFPSAVIQSIQVSKTFTPDQQGDASGGAVNVVLKGIPDETNFKIDFGTSTNSQLLSANDEFLSYSGGKLSYWGQDHRGIPTNGNFDSAIGTSEDEVPYNYKWSLSGGGKKHLDSGLKIGGFGSLFYERDSAYYDNGVDDKYWQEGQGNPLTPQYGGQSFPETDPVSGLTTGDFTTSMYDVRQASDSIQWGGLGILGFEYEEQKINFLYMFTQNTENKVTLAEDTRGKAYYFDDYDVNDPCSPANMADGRTAAPYLRNETLEYTERTTSTFQIHGDHTLEEPGIRFDEYLVFLKPKFDWTVSWNKSSLYQPDKRLFGSFWMPSYYQPGIIWLGIPPEIKPAEYGELAGSNVNLGNFQRVWKDINEESNQYAFNIKFPFEQWTTTEGFVKMGFFKDKLTRTYDQESFSNSDGDDDTWNGPWSTSWSTVFYSEDHQIYPSFYDVDYEGNQDILAWYTMADIPLNSKFNIIGGARIEETELSIANFPDVDNNGNILATWIEPGGTTQIAFDPADTNVTFKQRDVLPAISFAYSPLEEITIRGAYSETVARQTFKELSPIQQMEYLGGDVFIGNPALKMSSLDNYDLRFDYTPYDGGLVSLSYFYKKITDPIEYVKGFADFSYTYPVNYPEGELSGFEIEVRQQLGYFWQQLAGLSVGTNLTFINSEVTLPKSEVDLLASVNAPMTKRDMTNAPEHLFNFYATYDIADNHKTTVGIFYTVRGDTLIAGAGQSESAFIPSVYETEYGSLNLSLTHKFNDIWKMKFQVKNILNPDIQTVYRSKYTGSDKTKTSYSKGVDFSFSVSASF